MTTLKASLLQAIYQWAVDNQFTPYLVAVTDFPGVEVPASAVEQGQVVLNVHPRAVRDFFLDDDGVQFATRFSGVSHAISIPLAAVVALYAQENGEGMSFPPPEPGSPDAPDDRPTPGRPSLKVVK
jgi:stringent starvation protein B